MVSPSAVIQLASRLMHLHYCENDVESVIETFAPEMSWFGAGEDQYKDNYAATVDFFRQFRGAIPKCKISDEQYQATAVAEGCWVCSGTLWVSTDENSGRLLRAHQRVTFVFTEREGRLKCAHIHCSNPYEELVEGELFPDKVAKETHQYLEQRLREMEAELRLKEQEILAADETRRKAYEGLRQANRQIQVILNACRGGLKISRDDDQYSYKYVSDELCAIFGYTKEEFLAVTGGTAVGAVYPPDLPRVLREVKEAFRDGSVEYAIKYRLRCKDGSLRWIVDSGKKAVDESGEAIVNSIYLDVTELEKANQKITEQKEFLDSIYESILCGILRYRIEGDEFAFLTMNREALRLTGYFSEEDCRRMGPNALNERVHPKDRAQNQENLAQLRRPGDRVRQEYRLMTPGGDFWVYGSMELLKGSDGKPVIQCIIMDITEKKKLELALDEERKRFRIAIESTPAMIFEYDLAEDCFTSYGTLEARGEKHNVELILPHFFRDGRCTQVREEDRQMFRSLLHGEAGDMMELRMAPYYGSDDEVWARITVTALGGERHPDKVIGKAVSIQLEKEKEFALAEAKARDALTKLYTRDAGVRMVQEALARRECEPCAMLLVDMDDFKRVNMEEGDVFADAILQEVADILRSETGPQDICTRIGGDEFMIFARDCGQERAAALGAHIAEQIRQSFARGERDVALSASVGVCAAGRDQEYGSLYRCTESMLKYVKEHGKGYAACYQEVSDEAKILEAEFDKEEYNVSEIDRQAYLQEENLVSFALELLGKSKKLDDALFLLLSRIGKACGFDRVSIVEMDTEYLCYRFSYQWAKERAELCMDRDFYLTREQYGMISAVYDENGICENSDAATAMASCMHTAIWNRGMLAGALCFEVARDGYCWTQEQRRLLKELGKIIQSFLMKARADAVSQAKTDFLSRMSHEIRTPMNAIAGMTTIAKTVLDDREKALECLQKIEDANTYLLDLINDILDMSRIESGKVELHPESMDLAAFAASLEALFQPQAQTKGIALSFENRYIGGQRILADTVKLNQVLVNIIGNALKFTAGGGDVTVRIEPLQETAQELLVRFSVRDTGIGINPDAVGRVFNAFEQAEKHIASQYGGTGLGLSISNRLVQMMGGILDVSSEVGKGSEFYFSLKFPFTEMEPSKNAAKRPVSFDFTGRRLLLAEDNELNREIAQTILEMHGFTVETAVDGQEAMDKFASVGQGHYDAILMDIRMPVIDGLEATRRIRTMGKPDSRTIPIIAMTANAFDEDTRKSMESGMNGHLSKPIQVDVLLETLRNCLAGNGSPAAE